MKQVLIHKDDKKIKQAKDFFKSSIQFLQSACDKFKDAGFILEFDELVDITTTCAKPGIDINWLRDRLNSDIADTHIQTIKVFIANHFPIGLGVYKFEPNLMQYKNGKISASDEALTIIERRYSFYAENERGAEVSARLFAMAEAVNALLNYMVDHNVKIKGIGQDIPGLVFNNCQYMPDVSFIRDQERLFRNMRAKPNTRTLSDAA